MADAIHAHMDFATFITDLSHGKINARLTEELAGIADAVEETGKNGKLVVTFTVAKQGDMAVVIVDSKATEPKHPMAGSMFFFGSNGALLSEDPRQLKLKNLVTPVFKTVDGEEEE